MFSRKYIALIPISESGGGYIRHYDHTYFPTYGRFDILTERILKSPAAVRVNGQWVYRPDDWRISIRATSYQKTLKEFVKANPLFYAAVFYRAILDPPPPPLISPMPTAANFYLFFGLAYGDVRTLTEPTVPGLHEEEILIRFVDVGGKNELVKPYMWYAFAPILRSTSPDHTLIAVGGVDVGAIHISVAGSPVGPVRFAYTDVFAECMLDYIRSHHYPALTVRDVDGCNVADHFGNTVDFVALRNLLPNWPDPDWNAPDEWPIEITLPRRAWEV